MHQLRIGVAFEDGEVDPQLLNGWLEDLIHTQRVSDERRAEGERIRQRGEEMRAFCWELAFPEVFYLPDGNRRDDAGFTCVIGNPPWDKIKPERDEFYLQHDPLIRQLQGAMKDRRIAELHRLNPIIASAWQDYEGSQRLLAHALLQAGIYSHQTALVEEEVEGKDGEITVKKKTAGGDPDCFKFFLERAWQLASASGRVGMVMSSSLHQAAGCTGLRRLLFEHCTLKTLVKFDNELRVFPGVHNQFKFDLVVFEKQGTTSSFDAAFLTRERSEVLARFKEHYAYLRLKCEDLSRISPQTLTVYEFRDQRDFDLVAKAYRLHPPFGKGLYRQGDLRFASEFHMGNKNFLFRTCSWLRQNGCVREEGGQWRANHAGWYGEREYMQRPLAEWYVVFCAGRAIDYTLPWEVKRSSAVDVEELDDFSIRLDLQDGSSFFGKAPEEGSDAVFVPQQDASETDLPVHVYGKKEVGGYRIAPAIRPDDCFLPLMEGKWIHGFSHCAFAYVSGSGSWVVSRPTPGESEVIPHYFMARLDAATRASQKRAKIGFRSTAKSADERSFIACVMPGHLPPGDNCLVLNVGGAGDCAYAVSAILNAFVVDYFLRLLVSGKVGWHLISQIPMPMLGERQSSELRALAEAIHGGGACDHATRVGFCEGVDNTDLVERCRASIDAIVASFYELTVHEYARILTGFPLMDRDQPPLPHDHRLRQTRKGREMRPMSFYTRDLALLTYIDYLAGGLDIKPDAGRVARICPDGVPDAPRDIVEFFSEAGVDIAGDSEYAVAATGPIRDLRKRVTKARELGTVAYVPTIDRRRATFVEAAAAQGGLAPGDGVLTADMAKRVLEAKAERDAKMKRAMELWESTPTVETPVVIPFPTAATKGATTGTDGGKTKKVQRKRARQANGKKPSKQFEQAVMMTFLVDEIIKVGGTPTRERVQKHLYFAEEVCNLELGAEFMRKAAGPYAPGMRYKGPEGIAIDQNGWLARNGHVFDRGKNLAKGLGYAQKRVDPHRAALGKLIKHFKDYGRNALGRWATVHFAAKHVAGDGSPVTVEAVKAYLAADKEWVNKLQDDAYSDEKIESTLVGLRGFGFLSEEGSPT